MHRAEETMNLFESTDSFGSFKHEFVELFRSSSSHPVGENKNNDCESHVLDTGQGTRNRSNSEVGLESVCDHEVTLDLSVYAQAAASLANAGRVAQEIDCEIGNAAEPELIETTSIPKSDPKDLHDDLQLDGFCNFELPSIPEEVSEATEPSKSKKPKKKRTRRVYEPEVKEYREYTDKDVLCQRGGLANTHEGNRRFLAAKESLQEEYFRTDKLQRTKVSQKLVDVVNAWGGRFLRRDDQGWYIVHNHVARTKAGQALRETYTAEDRKIKRARYAKKKRASKF